MNDKTFRQATWTDNLSICVTVKQNKAINLPYCCTQSDAYSFIVIVEGSNLSVYPSGQWSPADCGQFPRHNGGGTTPVFHFFCCIMTRYGLFNISWNLISLNQVKPSILQYSAVLEKIFLLICSDKIYLSILGFRSLILTAIISIECLNYCFEIILT